MRTKERMASMAFVAVAGLLICPLLWGCSPAAPVSSPQAARLAERETWDVYRIQGTRAGYRRATIRHESRAGHEVVRIAGVSHLAVQRFGDRTEQEIRVTSVETPEGRLLEFETEFLQGKTPMRTTGRVVGDRLEIEVTTQGQPQRSSTAWSAEYQGLFATETSLLREPMQPGERRTIRGWMPGPNQVAAVEMSARGYEQVELASGKQELLRIEMVTRFSDKTTLRETVWCDRAGDTQKTWTDVMNIESFRATKAVALEQIDVGKLDLGTDIAVRVARPLPQAHETKRAVYRIELQGGDPAAVFATGPSQRVKSIDGHTAEVTVCALRPGQPGGNPDKRDDPPSDDDRRPNTLIQSDDERIVAMAREAAAGEKDPWQTALALEQHVRRAIKKKDFSTAFASAAEVAEHPEGDCTEHAVLLAALARARGIPARVAIGLVYLQDGDGQSFAYHLWDEVYIGSRWIAIDATLGKGGIGAAHLKLAHSNLQGASAYSAFLPIIQVLGRLKITIESAE